MDTLESEKHSDQYGSRDGEANVKVGCWCRRALEFPQFQSFICIHVALRSYHLELGKPGAGKCITETA